MEDLGRLLTIALAILTLATAAGLGLQRAAVTSLRERLKDSDEELARVNRRHDEAIAELKVVRGDLLALSRVVTGEAKLETLGEKLIDLGTKLDIHHSEAAVHWKRDEDILAEIRDRLPPVTPGTPPPTWRT